MTAIEQILEALGTLTATVNELKASVQLIEANIKILNNRAAGLMRNSVPETSIALNPISVTIPGPINPGTINTTAATGLHAGVPAQRAQQVMQAGTPTRGRQLVEAPEEQRIEAMNFIKETDTSGTLTYKKVYGKLVNNANEPIDSVLIKIYDKNNEVCSSTETDPIGYWETMLTPGRYVAEYVKTGFKSSNKTFEVGKNAKEVEVK